MTLLSISLVNSVIYTCHIHVHTVFRNIKEKDELFTDYTDFEADGVAPDSSDYKSRSWNNTLRQASVLNIIIYI